MMAEKREDKTKKVKRKKAKPLKEGEVNLYSIDGKVRGQVKLPNAFLEEIRFDLIKRSVLAAQANRRQPYGPNPMSGMKHAVSTWGKGRGVARVQRFSQGRTAAESPCNIGGRRAHPPRPEKNWSQKINKNERRKAKISALSATKDAKLIAERGHKTKKKITFPIVVENKLEEIDSTKQALMALTRLGISSDLERAKEGIHERAGKGKMRGRRYRKPRSVLVVVSDHKKALKGFRNIPGVDVSTPEHLNTEILAPGGMPGRLTVFTENAMNRIRKW